MTEQDSADPWSDLPRLSSDSVGVPIDQFHHWCALHFNDGELDPPPNEYTRARSLAVRALSDRAKELKQPNDRRRNDLHPAVQGLSSSEVNSLAYTAVLSFVPEGSPLPPEVLGLLFHCLGQADYRQPRGGYPKRVREALRLPRADRVGDFYKCAWEYGRGSWFGLVSNKNLCRKYNIDQKTLKEWMHDPLWFRFELMGSIDLWDSLPRPKLSRSQEIKEYADILRGQPGVRGQLRRKCSRTRRLHRAWRRRWLASEGVGNPDE